MINEIVGILEEKNKRLAFLEKAIKTELCAVCLYSGADNSNEYFYGNEARTFFNCNVCETKYCFKCKDHWAASQNNAVCDGHENVCYNCFKISGKDFVECFVTKHKICAVCADVCLQECHCGEKFYMCDWAGYRSRCKSTCIAGKCMHFLTIDINKKYVKGEIYYHCTHLEDIVKK